MDFGFGFSDQKLVGIRQNPNRGHFRPKICRPVLSMDIAEMKTNFQVLEQKILLKVIIVFSVKNQNSEI